jgi:hypothetical protein
MIGPTLHTRLTRVYASWLNKDDLGRRFIGAGDPQLAAGVASVRQFLEELIRGSSEPGASFSLPAAIEDPDSTFAQLLESPLVPQMDPPTKVEAIARNVLCLQIIPRLLLETFELGDQIDDGIQLRAQMLTESGFTDSDTLSRWLNNPSNHSVLADTLLMVLKSQLARRTIRSFFMVDVASNGYRLWGPQSRASKDAGTALARHRIHTSAGDVSIEVMRYSNDEALPVRAYEWCAELREDVANEAPDAVAYGMAYAFERSEGVPAGGRLDLTTAADCMADVDLLQVNAFFEQHPDAEALIEFGDLAFVWLWERRAGTRPGAGQACLRAALADVRRRLRGIRTVVIDLKPYQYVVSDGAAMPAKLHIEKLEAVDRLQSFVDGLHLEETVRGHCRYIVNRDEDDPNAAMRVLGLAGLAQRASPWQGNS